MLSSEPESLPAGVIALKKRHYVEGIALLENFLGENKDPLTKEILQAKMWLVRAYEHENLIDKALELCEEMKEIPHPQIQTWLAKVLPTLEAKKIPIPSSKPLETRIPFSSLPPFPEPLRGTPEGLFHQAKLELRQGQYLAAIQSLETYSHIESNRESLSYEQAQMTLVKLYRHLGQWDKAKKFCEKLLDFPLTSLQNWAQQTLLTLNYKQPRAHRCLPQGISSDFLKITLELPPSDLGKSSLLRDSSEAKI